MGGPVSKIKRTKKDGSVAGSLLSRRESLGSNPTPTELKRARSGEMAQLVKAFET